MLRWLLWGAIAVPIAAWGIFHLYHDIWWVENVISIPGIFLSYFALLSIATFALRYWAHFVVGVCSSVVFLMMAEPEQQQVLAHCATPVSVGQLTLSESTLSDEQWQQLIATGVDMLVIQNIDGELSKDNAKRLNAVFPHQYKMAASSTSRGQWLLSRFVLSNISQFSIGYGHHALRAVWHPVPQKQITLVSALLPYPFDQAQWSLRNALLRGVESQVYLDDQNEMLVVGNLSISATNLRFSGLFPGFETAPVASWPTHLGEVALPYFMMLSLDHVWLKSLQSGRRICSRTTERSISGEMHRMIKTVIGFR